MFKGFRNISPKQKKQETDSNYKLQPSSNVKLGRPVLLSPLGKQGEVNLTSGTLNTL